MEDVNNSYQKDTGKASLIRHVHVHINFDTNLKNQNTFRSKSIDLRTVRNYQSTKCVDILKHFYYKIQVNKMYRFLGLFQLPGVVIIIFTKTILIGTITIFISIFNSRPVVLAILLYIHIKLDLPARSALLNSFLKLSF